MTPPRARIVTIAAAGSAQPADHRTYFTFSGPVELSGVALAPGKYLFRIANPESSGNVVQVLSADGTKTYAMFSTLPVLRIQPSPDPSVQFMETPTGTPPAIRAWWDPGAVLGREFLYPKEQARCLAKTSRHCVRHSTTASPGSSGRIPQPAGVCSSRWPSGSGRSRWRERGGFKAFGFAP